MRSQRRGGGAGILLLGLLSTAALSFCSCSILWERNSESSESSPGEHQVTEPTTGAGEFESPAPVRITDPRVMESLKERGKYLVLGGAACGSCHGAVSGNAESPLSGGRVMQDRFGTVRAANITSDKETGIGSWGIAEVMRAVRASIDKDGKPLSLDLHSTYRWLSDNDAKAIAVYLLTAPGVRSPVERRQLGSFERKKWGLISQHSEVEGYVPAPPKSKSTAYGRYLAYHVSGCYGCHTPEAGFIESAPAFAGNTETRHDLLKSLKALFSLFKPVSPEDQKEQEEKTMHGLLSEEGQEEYYGKPAEQKIIARPTAVPSETPGHNAKFDEAIESGTFPASGPDIRGTAETGLLAWSEEQLVEYLSSGKRPDGTFSDARVCPWNYFQRLSTADKQALAGFLKQQ
ncbi:MAG: hypothetical protein U0136_20110 [Bdellovibrionota bacterium]